MRPVRFGRLKIFMVLCAAGLFSCGNQPLFDELATNRLKVVIKGTYESNGPRPWGPSCPEDDSIGDSIDDYTEYSGEPDRPTGPDEFMMDIAEIRLNGEKFANYRKTFRAPLEESSAFFNDGFVYTNDDVPDGFYTHVNMYIRKMIFDNARTYHKTGPGAWEYDEDSETIFREKAVKGFDFNQLQVNSYFDSLRVESGRINRIFPLVIPIEGGLAYSRQNSETVLEIRLVIKNFIKKYEYDYYSDYHYVVHYFGLSDWLRDVKADESDIGGNVIAVARAYVPGKTATVKGTVVAASNKYVVMIPAENQIEDYTLSGPKPIRPSVDPPKQPSLAGYSIEAYLDYFLAYEKYKEVYNVGFANKLITDYEGNYAEPWEDYNDACNAFRIPALVTYPDASGNFTFTNVPVGRSYKAYYWNGVPGSSDLPGKVSGGADFIPIETVDILESDAGSTITIPTP